MSTCKKCTGVTGLSGDKNWRETGVYRQASVSKYGEIMQSNTTRTASTTTTATTGSSQRRKGNDAESHSDSYSCSNSKSNGQSNSNTKSNTKSNSNSKSLPSVVCIEGNKSVFAAMVGRVVRDTIFPKKQFIIFDRELDENGKVAESCVQELQLDKTKWYSVRNLVRTRINRVRNNAQLSIRRKLLRKLVTLLFMLD